MKTPEHPSTRAEINPGAPWGWTDRHRELELSVVGATGAVGRELIALLLAAGHSPDRLDCRARRHETIEVAGVHLEVRPLHLESGDLAPGARPSAGWDLVFLCTPSELSLSLAPHLVERGTRVIDLSSAHRLRRDVPLVVPEINGGELARAGRLIANPNCTTAIAAMPLAVLEREAGLEEVVLVSFQAASGAGASGLRTLTAEMREPPGAASEGPSSASPFAARLALNVIPAVAEVDTRGISGEEQKVIDELRRILARPDLVVEVTTTRVPVERCHSVAVHVKLGRAFELASIVSALRAAPGIRVTDDPHGPRPRECAGTDPVHVGRIRRGTRGERSLCFFAVGDQIRKGAALNALQVAAALPAVPRSAR